ncbi:MAG: O-antigen ligase family protein [Clostridia bacterium]|nr:O-antigen ligase family protein [Clostridia bacterium]
MTALKTRLRFFYNSAFYPILVVLLAFIGHVTEFDVAFMALILLSMVPALLLCNNLRFAVMPILGIVFTVSIKDYKPNNHGLEERFLNAGTLIAGGITVAILVSAVIFFLIRNRKTCNRLPKNGLWLGLAVFCGVMLVNGIFSQNYTPMNFLYVILISATILGIYLLFALYTQFDGKTVDYFMFCFLLAGLLISAELIWAYFTTVRFDANGVVKGSVVLGWGIWTAIGGMLAFLMPACFYFAASHKHGWIGYLLGLLEFFCIVLSQSRGALLFGALALVLCILVLFFQGKNKKKNRIITLALIAVGIVGVILLWDKVIALLGNLKSFGLSDNGRYEKWTIGWNHFLDYPIFGSGFYDSFVDPAFEHGFDPYLYHNNLIQMLAACGIVGLLAYLFHRIQTVALFFKRPTMQKYFIAIALIAFLGFNLLDVLFFKFYPGFFYALMLLSAEKSEDMTA